MKYGRGVSLATVVDSDAYDIPGYAISHQFQYASREGIDYIDTAAAYNEENGELNVFVINRDWENDTPVEINVGAFEGFKLAGHSQLYTEDLDAANSYENPDAIVPSVNAETSFNDGKISASLKKLSWNVFRLTK
jgi:alpha-N-arabinofuranosidase